MSNTSIGVAVTGANGFVGKNLRNFLYKNKINVLGISRKNFRKHASEAKITSTNLLEPKLQTKLKNYDVLVHLIGIGRPQSSKSTFEETNLNLTKNVIKACKKAGIKKIIFISGLGVSKSNTSKYFVSKYKAELEIINSGLDYTIFRASYIIGKTDHLTKRLSKQMKRGTIIIPGSGKYRLQPIFVLDAAKIILEAILKKKFSKKIIDLVGPQQISFEDFVKVFSKNTKVKIHKISLESAYDEAKCNPNSVYSLESLNILVGDYISDGKQLQKLSNVKLTTVDEFLQSSRLS
jgi:NADH dehydrogenase